jgi:hypothetical protein
MQLSESDDPLELTRPYTWDGKRLVPVPDDGEGHFIFPVEHYQAITLARWSDARMPEPCGNCFAMPWHHVLAVSAHDAGESTGNGHPLRYEAWKQAAFAAMSYDIKQRHDEAARTEIEDLKKEWCL